MPSSFVTGAVKGLLNIAEKLTIRKGAVIVFQEGTAEPADPATGTLWFDSANSVLKFYDGSDWVTLTAGA